jgi:hypothetical protein
MAVRLSVLRIDVDRYLIITRLLESIFTYFQYSSPGEKLRHIYAGLSGNRSQIDTKCKTCDIRQRYWVFGLCPSSGFFLNNNEKHNVSGTGSVSVLRWGKTPTLLGPLERANQNHWPRTMDKARKPSISVCYAPSSEPYSIYLNVVLLLEHHITKTYKEVR